MHETAVAAPLARPQPTPPPTGREPQSAALSRRSSALLVLGLLALNVVAHFVPLERAALAPDDYAHWMTAQRFSMSEALGAALRQPDRPLGFLFVLGQERFLQGNPATGLALLILFSSLLVLLVFAWLNELCEHPLAAFLGTACFILLPQKLEVYHAPVYNLSALGDALYLVSAWSVVRYLKDGRRSLLALSLVSYSVAVLVYESGFLLPAVLLGYCWFHQRERLRAAGLFLVPAAAYLLVKLTRVFGLADPVLNDHRLDVLALPRNLVDFLHHYAGRYAARHVLYGASQWLRMETPWLLIILGANLVLLVALVRWLRRQVPPLLTRGQALLGVGVIAAASVPILLNAGGGVGGRNLVLPSVGLALVLVWALGRLGRRWRIGTVVLLTSLLIICQGNAWNQVVACRINGAVYATIREQADRLRLADRVILDARSLADRIPFTWVPREFNVLNTYYGAQALEDWGITAMVRSIVGPGHSQVLVASERPRVVGGDALEIVTLHVSGYRAATRHVQTVPREGTHIIAYDDIYPRGFHHGRR